MVSCLSNLVEELGLDDYDSIMAALKRYVTSDFFQGLARAAASRMVTMTRRDGFQTWRQAAAASSQGRKIYRALQEEMKGPIGTRVNQIVEENAKLISTFPEEVSDKVAKFMLGAHQEGLRSSAMAKALAKVFPDIALPRINLIARTETSKASTALIQARSEQLGAEWYIWNTSKDARVRPAHMKMDGVLVRWTDPPAPELLHGQKGEGYYHAGNIYNCRCYPQPLLDFDRVAWPAKVYAGGEVSRMTLSRFESRFGYRRAA